MARTPAAERTWSTVGMPEDEQFLVWHDAVSEAFVPVSMMRRSDGAFPSTIAARTVGPLGVAQVDSRAQTVRRGPEHIDRRAGDAFFLNLALGPGAHAAQAGRTATLAPGDFTLVDGSRPFELRFERAFRQFAFTLPHDLLAPLLAAPEAATALRIRGDRGVGAVAAGALRALARQAAPIDGRSARALAEQVTALVAMAIGAVHPPPASAGRGLLLQAALDEVERSLGDPDLDPGQVAARVGVSTRYLHALFADMGTSFGRRLLARRLERCHRDLVDPARAHWTIAQIARQHGFRDPSYFARAFRARYGIAPRQARRDPRSRVAGPARLPAVPGSCCVFVDPLSWRPGGLFHVVSSDIAVDEPPPPADDEGHTTVRGPSPCTGTRHPARRLCTAGRSSARSRVGRPIPRRRGTLA